MIIMRSFFAGCLLVASSLPVGAETTETLREVVNHAVLNNPEVSASWHNFSAALEEKKAARGDYLPNIDLVAQVGTERSDTPTTSTDSFKPDATRLTLTQLLFDGFETSSNVARLDYVSLARYYELRQASESVAQEAIVAYLDVARFSQLVELAKGNYIQHRVVHKDIKERAEAGVSRRVDFEQASGRLALAETNLLTEVTNLHDVMTRYQRVVGVLPKENLTLPSIPSDLIPASQVLAIEQAVRLSPVVNAAIETLRSAKAELKSKNAPFLPRFDLRLRKEVEHDTDGVDGRFDERAAEVVMTYNLYNGGSDKARKRQFYQRLNAAMESRIQACRDVRQTVAVAYNNIRSLKEQLVYLEANQIATGKARDAYRKQFDIGQRTLLDLLDEENEYFQVQRSFVNAKVDLLAAQAGTLAGMGLLLDAFSLDGLGATASKDLKLSRQGSYDVSAKCPVEAPVQPVIDKEELLKQVVNEAAATPTVLNVKNVNSNENDLSVSVSFAFQSDQLSPVYKNEISKVANYLIDNPEAFCEIEGHSDAIGTLTYNLGLSERRAAKVQALLVSEYGISPSRITSKGYGKLKPLSNNITVEGRSKNRRAELEVIEIPRNTH